jgi:hypothetical protein
MAGSVASTSQHFDLIASHLVTLYNDFALTPQSLRDSLAQTYRTLHTTSTSPRCHHGQEQEQAKAELQEDQWQRRITGIEFKEHASRTCFSIHHSYILER